MGRLWPIRWHRLIAWLSTSARQTGSQKMILEALMRFLQKYMRGTHGIKGKRSIQATGSVLQFHEKHPVLLRRFKGQNELLPDSCRNLSREPQIINPHQLQRFTDVRQR